MAGKPRYPRLQIGQEFTHPHTGHRWRVTDLGIRNFLAIDLTAAERDHPGDPSGLNGPPYALAQVWDAYDFGALSDVDGLEWADIPPQKALLGLLERVREFAADWKAQESCQASRLDALCDAAEAYFGEFK